MGLSDNLKLVFKKIPFVNPDKVLSGFGKNGFRFFFYSVLGCITLYYFFQMSYFLYDYYRLTEHRPGEILEWKIMESKKDNYIIEAKFSYTVNETKFLGKTLFKEPVFLNKDSAISYLQKDSNKRWTVWYPSSSPNDGTLIKKFPVKEVIYSIILILVFLHFLYIKRIYYFD